MAYYAQYYSELPTTFLISRKLLKEGLVGELRKFDTLVEARKYGAKRAANGGVVLIYSKNVDRYLYAINNPMQCPDIVGFVNQNKAMGWYFWNIPERQGRNTGEVYFKSRPMYSNGKMAGRF